MHCVRFLIADIPFQVFTFITGAYMDFILQFFLSNTDYHCT
jgi:hypothetical protein